MSVFAVGTRCRGMVMKTESTPVENDSVLTHAPRNFFTWEYSMERKHEVVRNAREKLKSLIK